MLRAARGATTVPTDAPEALQEALTVLIGTLLSENRIATDAIVNVFFTVTPDLTRISPAKIARMAFDWDDIPMLCAQEPVIDGLPSRCIRILIQFETDLSRNDIRHIYLNDAVTLRPDLFGEL